MFDSVIDFIERRWHILIFAAFILGLFGLAGYKTYERNQKEIARADEQIDSRPPTSRYGDDLVPPEQWAPVPFTPIGNPNWREKIPRIPTVEVNGPVEEWFEKPSDRIVMELTEKFNALLSTHPYEGFAARIHADLSSDELRWAPALMPRGLLGMFMSMCIDEDVRHCFPLLRVNAEHLAHTAPDRDYDVVMWWSILFHEHIHYLQGKLVPPEERDESIKPNSVTERLSSGECLKMWHTERQAYWLTCRMGWEKIGIAHPGRLCSMMSTVESFDAAFYEHLDSAKKAGYTGAHTECDETWKQEAGIR